MPIGHAKATVGSTVLAEADAWEEVEGNVYFPPSSIKTGYFSKTEHSTHCPWKGDASYYTIKTDGERLPFFFLFLFFLFLPPPGARALFLLHGPSSGDLSCLTCEWRARVMM